MESFRLFFERVNKKTRDVISRAESKRDARSDDVIIYKWEKDKTAKIPKVWNKWNFDVESKERTQKRHHQGYIITNSNNSLEDTFCTCNDFKYKWHYAMNNRDMASWDTFDGLEPEIEPCNRDFPIETNPELVPTVCKHILAVLHQKINI